MTVPGCETETPPPFDVRDILTPTMEPTSAPFILETDLEGSPGGSSTDTVIIVGASLGGIVVVCLTALGVAYMVFSGKKRNESSARVPTAHDNETGHFSADLRGLSRRGSPELEQPSVVDAQVLEVTPTANIVAARVPPTNLEFKDQSRSVAENLELR